jgi:hypothetical protein
LLTDAMASTNATRTAEAWNWQRGTQRVIRYGTGKVNIDWNLADREKKVNEETCGAHYTMPHRAQ